MRNLLALALEAGQGSRLYPLTHMRAKPAVPIGGKYRLIDVPVSNCLHADVRRIYVLTQFNSNSLNRHISSTYRMDPSFRRRSSASPPISTTGYWADVGRVESFYDANIQLTHPAPPFSFHDPTCPIYPHERFLSPSRMLNCEFRNALVSEGSYVDGSSISDSVVGIRSIVRGGAKIRRSVLLGADYYESDIHGSGGQVPLGIGANVEPDRVIVDKNPRIGEGARLLNIRGVQEEDRDGYYIRNGIVVVPKGATVTPGSAI